MSTFLYTGKTFKAVLFDLTIFSFILVNFESFLSEKPIDLILLNSSKVLGSPFEISIFSSSTISLI